MGLGLAAFFWLPALYDKQYVFFDQAVVSNFYAHFPSLRQLLLPGWGYGPSLPFSDKDLLSFQLGIANLIVLVAAGLLFGFGLFRSSKRLTFLKKHFKTCFFLLLFLISFFLMNQFSSWVWQVILVSSLIQFPWRLLSLTTFAGAFLAGAFVSLVNKRLRLPFSAALIMLVIFLNYNYAKPECFVNRGEAFYSTNEATTTVANEYLPIWVKKPPLTRAQEKVEIITGEGEISNLSTNSRKVSFIVETESASEIQINTHYFPGWKVKVDGQITPLAYANDRGLMRLNLQPGQHYVVASFDETPLRLFADAISGLSFLAMGGLIIKNRRKR